MSRKAPERPFAIPAMSKYKQMEQKEGMRTKVWGPPAWVFLHTVAHNYPLKPTREDRKNYKNFFTNSYAESINLVGDTLTVKNTYQQPVHFEVIDFGKGMEIKETINMDHMSEVIWLTKYLGDYNINKYGKDLVLQNEGYVLKLRRIT